MITSRPILAAESAVGGIALVFIALALIIVGAVLISLYISRKRTIFRIDYAGGNIGFDLSWITQDEAIQFQKTLRTYKDKKDNEKYHLGEQVALNKQNTISVPDELKKYNELFQQGIITQEEYEAKKKQLLGL